MAGFCGYGVMASCFTILAITLVNRRETGLLKRLRLSPLPTWMLMDAVIINAMIVAALGVVLLLAVGWLGYGVSGPAHWAPFIVTLLVAMVCYSAMGVGISTLVPNAGRRGPDRQPDLLHPRGALGPVVPDRARIGAGHLRRLLPDPPPHRRAGGVVHGATGHARLAVARPRRDADLGRGRHGARAAALDVVAQARVTTRRGNPVG